MNLKYRPFAVLGFTVLTVLLVCLFLTDRFAVAAIAAGFMLFIISLAFKRVREKVVPLYVAGALVFSGIMFSLANEGGMKYAQTFVGKTAEIEGVITDKPDYSEENSRYYYVLDLDTIDGKAVDIKLRLSLPNDIGAGPYDTIRLKANIYEIAAEIREIQLYYHSKGIFLGAYEFNSEDDFKVSIEKRETASLAYKIFTVREIIKSRIFDKLPNENGATVIAMLLGDKENLPDELNEKFSEVGIAPIFAVSGLHLSIWVMGLYSLLSQLGIKKRLNSVIGLFFTVFFMLLTGLTPSVCRAGLMMILLLSGNLFYRKTDSINSLGFAAFILCSVNPFTAANIGFLLSFSATLGIVALMPILDKYILSKLPKNILGKTCKGLISVVSVSIFATIGVFPVTVFFIGYISLFTVISNVLVTYAATLCMFAGGLCAMTYSFGFMSDFFALVSGLLSKYILWLVRLISDFPLTTVSVDNIFWQIGTIACVAVVIVSIVSFKGKTLAKFLACGLSFVILICGVTSYLYYDGLTQIRILNVGNGVSAVIFKDDSKLAVTGEADGYNMSAEITDNLNQISRKNANLLIIGDKNGADSASDFEIVKNINFNKILVPVSSQSLESVVEKNNIIESGNASVDVWDGGVVRVYSDDNYSLVHCTFENITLLMLLDSTKKSEIPEEYLSADYLVCSGYIPQCISPENYKKVIVCGEGKYPLSVYSYVSSCGGSPVLASNYESVVINIREDSNKFFGLEG